MFVKINGETHYIWRAVDHEGEVLEVFATRRRDRHLNRRDIFKQTRAAALAEWRRLAA